MAGELMTSALLTEDGIQGDRVVQVRDASGRTVTARTHPALLALHATVDETGAPLVEGRPWTDPAVLEAVQKIVGRGTSLVREESGDRFDVLPLLVATDGAVAAFGRDRRRLRPNILIGGVKEREERGWPGHYLVAGGVVIGIHDLRGRCVMTTFDPDTLEHDPGVLRDIRARFGGKLALNCNVVRGGRLEIGETVFVHPPRQA
jgi:uncharacterized protein YcbX